MEKDGFGVFLRRVKPEIECVEKLLRRQLSEEPEGLVVDLRRAEVWYARLQTIFAFAECCLDRAEKEKLPSKENLTELEREKVLAYRVAQEKLLRDHLSNLLEALKTRILLGQTILNYHRDLHLSEKGKPKPAVLREQR